MATLTRVLTTTAATLRHTFAIGETPTDPTGTPTCAVTDANGTSVATPTVTVTGDGSGVVTAPLPGQAQLSLLTVTWTATVGGASVTEVDYVEVVGGFFFSLVEGRASDPTLSDPAKYSEADLERGRLEVEIECEQICDRAFVPRYRRVVLDGTGTSDLILPNPDVRQIRRAAIAPRLDGTFTDLTATQLAALAATDDRVLRRVDGLTWYEGLQNIVVEYEYGLDAPPPDLALMAKVRLRSRLHIPRSSVPDRATSYTVEAGGTYRLSMPGAYKTGIPDVDAAYDRYSLRERDGGKGRDRSYPAGRTLTFTPQRYSLFHGGYGGWWTR